MCTRCCRVSPANFRGSIQEWIKNIQIDMVQTIGSLSPDGKFVIGSGSIYTRRATVIDNLSVRLPHCLTPAALIRHSLVIRIQLPKPCFWRMICESRVSMIGVENSKTSQVTLAKHGMSTRKGFTSFSVCLVRFSGSISSNRSLEKPSPAETGARQRRRRGGS